jgi:hypothetical protein
MTRHQIIIYNFTCNGCGKSHMRREYSPPTGWQEGVSNNGQTLAHCCSYCLRVIDTQRPQPTQTLPDNVTAFPCPTDPTAADQ